MWWSRGQTSSIHLPPCKMPSFWSKIVVIIAMTKDKTRQDGVFLGNLLSCVARVMDSRPWSGEQVCSIWMDASSRKKDSWNRYLLGWTLDHVQAQYSLFTSQILALSLWDRGGGKIWGSVPQQVQGGKRFTMFSDSPLVHLCMCWMYMANMPCQPSTYSSFPKPPATISVYSCGKALAFSVNSLDKNVVKSHLFFSSMMNLFQEAGTYISHLSTMWCIVLKALSLLSSLCQYKVEEMSVHDHIRSGVQNALEGDGNLEVPRVVIQHEGGGYLSLQNLLYVLQCQEQWMEHQSTNKQCRKSERNRTT